jgi:predicted alpha-1,2-mannosidase
LVGTGEHGHTFPGATTPFGLVQLSPDTRTNTWDGCSGYHYSDSVILGFSHTHLSGTGASCLGDILLMPATGEVQLNPGVPGDGYASRFSHATENATPGYYRVFLETPRVTAELTATARCGFHRYTFPTSDESHFILDLVHGIGNTPIEATLEVENNHTVSGSRTSQGWGGKRTVYFVMEFSRPFESCGIQQDGKFLPPNTAKADGQDVKAWFNYKTTAKEAILVKVGISGTSVAGAQKNLETEIPNWDFDAIRAATARQWQRELGAIDVKTFDPHIRATFYANLYLTAIAPNLFDDVDGAYRGYDSQNHTGTGFQNYSTFSIWDIYRTEWPLLMLLHSERIDDMVQSMLAEYQQLGRQTLPVWPLWGNETWCMPGYHSADMIAAAYLNGFHGFAAETAFHDMHTTAMQDRRGLDAYRERGYGPLTSISLEYTVDDWCIGRMAQALGHNEDASLFYRRSANYCNLFDRSTGFFRARLDNGQWREPFDPLGMVNDQYSEADAWQYAFYIQHDVPGLIRLFGGNERFIQKLDQLFTTNSIIHTRIPDLSGRIGQYIGGNEQSGHIGYLYDYAGAPYKTQYWVRQAMTRLYNDTPAGEPGNVDCGQMAAWYVFSALGFYPVNPGSGVFVIGSPLVSKAVIHLTGEKYHNRSFTIIARHNSPQNIYIQSATLDGKPLLKPWFTWQQLVAGGTLKVVMGSHPNPAWGSALEDAPPATMPAGFQYSPLPAPSAERPLSN